jgi:glycosyltransferase involved in cell wall biosynthesis
VGRRLSRLGGMQWLESALGTPSPGWADARLAWEERLGVPALLDPRAGDRPLVSGVIWLTDDDARLGAATRAVVRRALHAAGALFVLSSAQLPVLARRWGVPAGRLHHVPFGVDTDFWNPDRPVGDPVDDGPSRLVLGVGNDRHRAHDVLVAAVRQVQQGHPAVRLHLVTRRPVDVAPGVGRRHPHLGHPALRALYARAAVVAVATRDNLHVSGITTILEAMALGRPVVATGTPGMADYVEDGVTGLLVPPGDPEALARAVGALLQDRARAEALGAAARRRVHQCHSSQTQAARLAAVLAAASG